MLKQLALLPVVLILLRYGLHFALRKEYRVHESGGVVVTGASSGIGKHAAISLAKKGYTVYACCRSKSDMEKMQAEGVSTLRPVILDVTKQATIDSAFDFIQKDLGTLPLIGLVNNAGIAKTSPVEIMDLDKHARANFEVNYFGVIAVTQKFLPLLRKTGDGARIVQISSLAGLVSSANGNPYSATKFAMESLNDAMRLELDPWKISVSIINPAFVESLISGKAAEVYNEFESAPAEHQKLYGHLLGKKAFEKRQQMVAKADSPQVTTDVIEHAIMSPYPEVRYVVANVDGTPAWVLHWVMWLLPERAADAITLAILKPKE